METGLNEYNTIASSLCDYINNMQYEYTNEEISAQYANFRAKFAPEVLSGLSDSDVLKYIFLTADSDNSSLCYYLEFDSQIKRLFGSISGGSSYKFGLFQRQEDKQWVSGSPTNPEVLTDDDALILGKQIRDYLVKGCEIISSCQLMTVAEYEELDNKLNTSIGKYASYSWFQKYFHMMFPNKLVSIYSKDLQSHFLYGLGIIPNEKSYARNGQLAIIMRQLEIPATHFYEVCYKLFGCIKHFYRLGSSDQSDNYADKWRSEGIVAIGWNDVGNLVNYLKKGAIDKDKLANRLQELYYTGDAKTASRKAGEIKVFYETNADSVFVVANGANLIAFVDELSPYYYDSNEPMAHCKKGTWHSFFNDDDKMPESEGYLTTCYEIKKDENLVYIYNKYFSNTDSVRPDFEIPDSKETTSTSDDKKDCLEISLSSRTTSLHPLNCIIYGAPGTGKTYSTAEYALAIIEGKPVDKKRKTITERKAVMATYNDYIRKGQIVFTTFHQSYGYEEFIQGLRPDTKSERMSFVTVDGVFKRIADTALKDAARNYVIIIDEINRANISKVFGELITLIENDKRWGEINETCATLQSGDVFAVPNNLYIVGTMNSADKSISLIDAALRRRFEFIEQYPDETLIDDQTLKIVFNNLNHLLADNLESSDLLIGHSYFMGKTGDDLCQILNNNIIPLLYEYFYDNKKKVIGVLKEALKNTNIGIIDNKISRIFVQKKEDIQP